jgi:basic membrane protein A
MHSYVKNGGENELNRNKFLLTIILLFTFSMFLVACGGSSDNGDNEESTNEDNAENGGATEEADEDEFSVAMVTDTGGVDDKSFNQSAWEGLQAWGEEFGKEKGIGGYDYAQSEDDSDYMPNFTRLVKNDFDLVFGVGFLLEDSVEQIGKQFPDNYFAIIDTVAEGDNVASLTYAEHEGSFLAGVAAAMKTNTDKLGFLGGVDSDLINKFEVGFVAGAKSVNPDIEVKIQYAEDFNAVDKGKLIASNMFNSGIDIVYHAAGNTGNGVFAEAKDIKQNDPDREIWVIGVDRDQYEEGLNADKSASVTLTSMVKRVDVSVIEVTKMAMNGEFPGGETLVFGLEEEGITVADTNKEEYTEDIAAAVAEWEEKILSGEVEVPKTREELKDFEKNL